MRFTGKKALAYKVAFLRAFNAMAEAIKNEREGLSYRRAVHELSCKDSERRGSVHGRGLSERKQEFPASTLKGRLCSSCRSPACRFTSPDFNKRNFALVE